MKIISLFRGYFLALILIQGFILGVIDCRSFKKEGMSRTFEKAKVINKSVLILGIALYFLRIFIFK